MQRAEDKRREHTARDKLDRATVEQVMDPRTRMILFRLLSRGKLVSLEGCVSTGKEANVYYGTGADDVDVAVKVFKTAILSFKDRERYVAGEFRFRKGGYNRSSNRKMVQQWAEKEFRNLLRLREAGIHAPTPLILKPPVLVMTFFGHDGWPAPRLKDASLSPERLSVVYVQVCCLMRRMYCRAKLVHGDLSEYNILYHQGQAVIIDVSQSVEDDHPLALDFLRRDCLNINEFFSRGGVSPVLGVRELFEFVTHVEASQDRSGACEDDEKMLQRLESNLSVAQGRSEVEDAKIAEDDKVFMQTFIPRALGDIVDHEGEILKVATEGADSILFGKLADVPIPLHVAFDGARHSQAVDRLELPLVLEDAGEDAVSEANENSVTSSSSSGSWSEDAQRQSPEEAKSMRKEQKKHAKAESRAKRAQKTPKHVKKRKEILAKRRRHLKA
jgi:RIO kinase 1